MSRWTSTLFVFKDDRGQDYVSTALPVGVIESVTSSCVRGRWALHANWLPKA